MKPFVLMHSISPRDPVLRALDQIPAVRNWRAHLGVVFVIADDFQTPYTLTELLRPLLPSALFIFTELDMKTAQGWADQATWNFLSNPQPSGWHPPLAKLPRQG